MPPGNSWRPSSETNAPKPEKASMARITVDDCLKKIPTRSPLPLAATSRARQLSAGASPLVEPNRDKSTVIALREIAAGKVGTEVLKKNPTPPASTLRRKMGSDQHFLADRK